MSETNPQNQTRPRVDWSRVAFIGLGLTLAGFAGLSVFSDTTLMYNITDYVPVDEIDAVELGQSADKVESDFTLDRVFTDNEDLGYLDINGNNVDYTRINSSVASLISGAIAGGVAAQQMIARTKEGKNPLGSGFVLLNLAYSAFTIALGYYSFDQAFETLNIQNEFRAEAQSIVEADARAEEARTRLNGSVDRLESLADSASADAASQQAAADAINSDMNGANDGGVERQQADASSTRAQADQLRSQAAEAVQATVDADLAALQAEQSGTPTSAMAQATADYNAQMAEQFERLKLITGASIFTGVLGILAGFNTMGKSTGPRPQPA